jgi:hypothetical protein
MRIEMNCSECCGNRFTLVTAQADCSEVRYRDCGHAISTLADLKERVAEEVVTRTRLGSV